MPGRRALRDPPGAALPPADARLSRLVPARAGRGNAGHPAGGQPARPEMAFLARHASAGLRGVARPRPGLVPVDSVGGYMSCRSGLRLFPNHEAVHQLRLLDSSMEHRAPGSPHRCVAGSAGMAGAAYSGAGCRVRAALAAGHVPPYGRMGRCVGSGPRVAGTRSRDNPRPGQAAPQLVKIQPRRQADRTSHV